MGKIPITVAYDESNVVGHAMLTKSAEQILSGSMFCLMPAIANGKVVELAIVPYVQTEPKTTTKPTRWPKDELDPIAIELIKFLPDTPWEYGETKFSILFRLASASMKPFDAIPSLTIELNKKQYDYLKEQDNG